MKSEMFGRVEYVGPETAARFLASSRGNRTLRKSRVSKYVEDAKANRWNLSPHGLCFDVEQRFVDGHHRCQMVIDSGLSLPFFVIHNVPLDALPYIDTGLARSASDALSMAGMGDYSTALLSAARNILGAPDNMTMRYTPPADLIPIIDKYAEGLQFACRVMNTHTSGVSRAVRVLLARAWYTQDENRLEDFGKCLTTGLTSDPSKDSAAIVFRNFLQRAAKGGGSMVEVEKYQKGQCALAHFLRYSPITKLYGTQDDLFPLP